MKKLLKYLGGKGSYIIGLGIASLIGGLISAVALAAIPDNNGVIHSCYKTSSGTLRLIDTQNGGSCLSSETPLNWSAGGGSKIVSNRIVLSITDTSSHQLLSLPNFGVINVTCNASSPIGPSLIYLNNSSHNIEFGNSYGSETITPGNDSTNIIQYAIPTPSVLAYTDGGTNYVATIETEFQNTLQDCQFVAQATLSQN